MMGLPYSRISKAAHKSLLPSGRRRGPRLFAWEDEGLSCSATDPHPPSFAGPHPLPDGRGGPWVIFKMFSSCSYARNREMSLILAPMGWEPAVQGSPASTNQSRSKLGNAGRAVMHSQRKTARPMSPEYGIRRHHTYCSNSSCAAAQWPGLRPGARRAIGLPSNRSSPATNSGAPSGRPVPSERRSAS